MSTYLEIVAKLSELNKVRVELDDKCDQLFNEKKLLEVQLTNVKDQIMDLFQNLVHEVAKQSGGEVFDEHTNTLIDYSRK